MSNRQGLSFLDIEGGSASLTSGSVPPTSQLEGDLTVKPSKMCLQCSLLITAITSEFFRQQKPQKIYKPICQALNLLFQNTSSVFVRWECQ